MCVRSLLLTLRTRVIGTRTFWAHFWRAVYKANPFRSLIFAPWHVHVGIHFPFHCHKCLCTIKPRNAQAAYAVVALISYSYCLQHYSIY
uniref:Putative secreted peptide n=1 Tax=Anopheles braziliensis TaxID=58242 RepID=A0A2M3ZPG3_9DIPT